MNQEIRISPAGITDIPLIILLAETIWPSTYSQILSWEQIHYMMDWLYSPSALLTQMEIEGHHFLLLWEGETPVGFASFSPQGEKGYRLHKIYLLPSCQGKGMGKKLLKEVVRTAAGSGGQFLDLNVNRYNPARYFYEKQGFTILETVDIPIGNGFFMNDYVMRLQLNLGREV